MPVAVNQPQRREKKDPLDTIMKGLNIAASVYGIKEGREKSALLKQQFALQQEQANAAEFDSAEKMGLQQDQLASENAYRAAQTAKLAAETDAIKKGKVGGGDPELRALRIDALRSQIDDRKQKTLDGANERLSSKLQNAGDLNSAITNIEKKLGFNLEEYEDGTPLDLPGKSVPGIGRVTFYDKEARTLDSAVAKVFNVELRDRSGAAVTTPELDRLRTEFASGRFNSEEEMIAALRDYKIAFRDAVQNIEAGYSPEVIALREERGGFTGKSISRGAGKPDQRAQIDMKNRGGGLSVLPNANAAAASGAGDFSQTQDLAGQLLLKRQGMKGKLPR